MITVMLSAAFAEMNGAYAAFDRAIGDLEAHVAGGAAQPRVDVRTLRAAHDGAGAAAGEAPHVEQASEQRAEFDAGEVLVVLQPRCRAAG